MKVYIGKGSANFTGPCEIQVAYLDTLTGKPQSSRRKLIHRKHHSPDGFSWGYGGSGPADTARSILWDYLHHEPHPALYQAFKNQFVARWPMHEGECWRITSKEIAEWIPPYLEMLDEYVD